MKQAALMLVLAAVAGTTPACDSEVAPAPRATPPAARAPVTPAPPAATPLATPAAVPVSAAPAAPATAEPSPPPAPIAAPAPAAVAAATPPEPDPPPAPVAPAIALAPVPAVEPVADVPATPDEASPFPADVVLTTGSAWIAAAGRSPLGGPGESTPQPALKLGEVATVDPTPGAPVVAWDEAHRRVGEQITVEGRIVSTNRSKSNVVFLNFDRDWKGKFYVPVFRDASSTMPVAAERFFLNKTVRVTGEVKLFDGVPNIAVNQLSQISVVGGR